MYHKIMISLPCGANSIHMNQFFLFLFFFILAAVTSSSDFKNDHNRFITILVFTFHFLKMKVKFIQ